MSPIVKIYDELAASANPRRPFVVSARTLSYGQIFGEAARVATLFDRLGIGFHDRVAIASDDDLTVISIFIASLRCGVAAIVLDPRLPPDEITSLLVAVEPKAAFIDRAMLDRMARAKLTAAGITIIDITFARESWFHSLVKTTVGPAKIGDPMCFPALLRHTAPAERLPAVAESLVACILFTPGTTGRPTGVEITHRNLFAQASTLMRHYDLGGDTRLLNLCPLHQTAGLILGAWATFAAGGSLVRPFAFELERVRQLLGTIYLRRITHFVAAPAVLESVLALGSDHLDAFRTGDFRYVIATGPPLEETLWSAFERAFGAKVANAYGPVEATGAALHCGPDAETRRIGTAGRPIDCEAKIVDRHGREVADGSIGELALRGANIMKGYFRLPQETAAVLKEGWLLTGDLALRDADGFFRVIQSKETAPLVDKETMDRAVDSLDKGELQRRVFAAAARVFGVSAELLWPESAPETVDGWTSLAHVELLLELEHEFGIEFSPKEVLTIHALGDAVRVIGARLGGGDDTDAPPVPRPPDDPGELHRCPAAPPSSSSVQRFAAAGTSDGPTELP